MKPRRRRPVRVLVCSVCSAPLPAWVWACECGGDPVLVPVEDVPVHP